MHFYDWVIIQEVSQMHKAKFVIETVTPLFIGGADQYDIKNEGLRVPSLRGAMRWWYRALLGSRINDIKEIYKNESEMFGSTDKKSTIIVRVSPSTGLKEGSYQKQWNYNIDYLFFSFRKTKSNPARPYYDEKSKFTIELLSRDKDSLEKASYLLWLLAHLGSIGSRSRRGAGSLNILSVNDEFSKPSNVEFFNKANSWKEYCQFMSKNLKNISDHFLKGFTDTGTDQFAILNSRTAEIYIKRSDYTKWLDALNDASMWLKEQRMNLKNRNPSNDLRPFLGLPMKKIKACSDSNKVERRSSPIWIAVARSESGKCFLRMCIFKSQFLPNFSGRFTDDRRTFQVNASYEQVLSKVLRSLEQEWEKVIW